MEEGEGSLEQPTPSPSNITECASDINTLIIIKVKDYGGDFFSASLLLTDIVIA